MSIQSAYGGGKVVNPLHLPSLPPGDTPVRHHGHPPGTEPANLLPVAQCLNQLRHCVPREQRQYTNNK
jgi:hypothetical protein